MNVLESCSMLDPFEVSSECGKFIIDDITNPFVLHDVTFPDREYTLSLYVKSDAAGSLDINDNSYITTSAWSRIVLTFTATQTDISFGFTTVGTYYIFHPQLEVGNKATDWAPNAKDLATDDSVNNLQNNIDATNERVTVTESLIQQLSNCISMLVRDENGQSLMTQTPDGWTFSMADTNSAMTSLSSNLDDLLKQAGDTASAVKLLQGSVNELEETAVYIHIGEYQTLPCIVLGKEDSDYTLMVTNENIMFMNGGDVPTYINATGLVTQNITIEGDGELRHGAWVWKQRANLNYGLQWTGCK